MKNYLKIESKVKYLIFILVYYFLYPVCYILYGRKNNWLICERGDDAQDNGYYFFKYINETKHDIHIVYLIHKSSSDYSKVNSIGKVVEFGSIRHFLMMIGYPVKISSNLYGYSPWINSTLYFRRNKTHHRHIFLQHGITFHNQPSFYKQNCKSISLICSAALLEQQYFIDYFGYKEQEVMLTGFPRFDNLTIIKNKNKHILIMPTWRKYLRGICFEEFKKSCFFKHWNMLINDRRLINLCLDCKVKIDLYMHHEMQDYLRAFDTNCVVNFVTSKDKTVQTLLKESSLLITDYSSVFFDFAYMIKPIIYFQFDKDDFYNSHYQKGFFDFYSDGFGDVNINIDEVFNSVLLLISEDLKMPKIYLERVRNFFNLEEKGGNCDRVFLSIKQLL